VLSKSASKSMDICQECQWVWTPSKATMISLSKKLYHHCSLLIGSWNEFEHDLHKQNW